jgi:hypothetical protein
MARIGFLALSSVGEGYSELTEKNLVGQSMPPTSRSAMLTATGNQPAVQTQPKHEPYTVLDEPMLTPADIQDQEFAKNEADMFGNDGTRSSQTPLAPGSWQEMRVMMAQRGNPHLNWTPGAAYANADPQKGGAPGGGLGDPNNPGADYTIQDIITSQGPDGVTRKGGAPPSPLKLSYGWSDWWGHTPTFVGAHLKIQWNANPNKPQLNPTPFNTEGPSQNTRYTTPAPFAAGTYIG